MKLRLVTFVLLLACFALPAIAQETPKAEVFGAFSVLHISNGAFKETPLGWQASVAGNVRKNFSLVADFGGQYKDISGSTFHTYQYLFGPRVNARMEKATVFAHALYGGNNSGRSGSSQNGFMMGYGGGVDVKASDNVSIRVIQFDWLPNRANGNWVNNVTRYGFGVVFGLGN